MFFEPVLKLDYGLLLANYHLFIFQFTHPLWVQPHKLKWWFWKIFSDLKSPFGLSTSFIIMPSTWCFLFFVSMYTYHSVKTPRIALETQNPSPSRFVFPPFFASLLHTHILHYSYSIFFPPYTTTANLPPIYPNLPPIYTIYTIYPIYPIYPIFSPK